MDGFRNSFPIIGASKAKYSNTLKAKPNDSGK